MSRWIAMHCGDEAEALQAQHPSAFLLLCQIARRAKWKDCRITKMKKGEALIGDWKEAGIHSQMAYRIAKQTLADCGLATFQGTNKGTRAILSGTTIFSLTSPINNDQGNETGNDPTTTQQRTRNDPTTTNHTDTRNTQSTPTSKNKSRGSLEELKAFAVELGLPASDGESMFHHWEANGWRNGSSPSKDWQAGIRKWQSQGWLPSQKAVAGVKPRIVPDIGGRKPSSIANWDDAPPPVHREDDNIEF